MRWTGKLDARSERGVRCFAQSEICPGRPRPWQVPRMESPVGRPRIKVSVGGDGQRSVGHPVRESALRRRIAGFLPVTVIDLKQQVQMLLETLSPNEQEALRLRFGIGGMPAHRLEHTALGPVVDGEFISRVEAEALRKLRRPRTGQETPVRCRVLRRVGP